MGKNKKIKCFNTAITIILAILALVIQHIYFTSQKNQYLEQQIPEIDCNYKYYAGPNKNKIIVKNVGFADCESIWIEERIFVIINNQIYEGDDIPHYNYLVYNGSRERMFDLKIDAELEIETIKHQYLSFVKLREKFRDIEIISKWIISYSGTRSGKRYSFNKYFLHSSGDRIPIRLRRSDNGVSMLNKIKDYFNLGIKHSIKIFSLSDDFELDTPTTYLINDDYSITPIYPGTTLTIEEINKSLVFVCSQIEPQPSDDIKGSILFSWKYEEEEWQKMIQIESGKEPTTWYSKVFQSPIRYLSQEEYKLVEKDPTVLKSINSGIEEEYIEEEARKKFLRKR